MVSTGVRILGDYKSVHPTFSWFVVLVYTLIVVSLSDDAPSGLIALDLSSSKGSPELRTTRTIKVVTPQTDGLTPFIQRQTNSLNPRFVTRFAPEDEVLSWFCDGTSRSDRTSGGNVPRKGT